VGDLKWLREKRSKALAVQDRVSDIVNKLDAIIKLLNNIDENLLDGFQQMEGRLAQMNRKKKNKNRNK
jgi:hypothetical protein